MQKQAFINLNLVVMKRFGNILCCLAAIASGIISFASCDVTPHRGGGGYEPEKPNRPGEGDGTVELYYGYGDFYGPYYNDKTDNYLIYLYEGETDSQGNFTRAATFLTLDFILPRKGDLKLQEGEYICSDRGEAFTFIPGWINRENGQSFLDGSKIYIQQSPSKYAEYAISSGKISIYPLITGQYEIKCNVAANGHEYSFYFKGTIDIEDHSQSQGGGDEGGNEGDIPKNVEMNSINRVVAEDWGMVWDGIPCTSYRDYILYFYDKDYSTTSEYTCIEILTEEKYQRALPDATFNKVVAVGSPDEFVPGAIIAGYSDDDDFAWGTWYCKGGIAWYAASKGSLEMKATEKGYSLVFDFVDEDETYGGTFKGSYEGKVEFTVPETKSGDAVRRPAGKVMRQISRVKALPKARL